MNKEFLKSIFPREFSQRNSSRRKITKNIFLLLAIKYLHKSKEKRFHRRKFSIYAENDDGFLYFIKISFN